MVACRINKMEGELMYYRCLLFGAASETKRIITSYPSGEYRPVGNQFGTRRDIAAYSTVPAYSYPPSTSLVAPFLANNYQRARSHDSSGTGS
jgi:hypothetical protein